MYKIFSNHAISMIHRVTFFISINNRFRQSIKKRLAIMVGVRNRTILLLGTVCKTQLCSFVKGMASSFVKIGFVKRKYKS